MFSFKHPVYAPCTPPTEKTYPRNVMKDVHGATRTQRSKRLPLRDGLTNAARFMAVAAVIAAFVLAMWLVALNGPFDYWSR
jgi:hypothetical protein